MFSWSTNTEALAELREEVAGLLRLVQDHRQMSREAAAAYRGLEAERDALRAALSDAATSLETIGRLAGKPYYGLDDKGEPIPTYMGHNDEVRSYANSRAGAARAAMKGTQ